MPPEGRCLRDLFCGRISGALETDSSEGVSLSELVVWAGGLEAGAAGVERLKVCLGGEARSSGHVDDFRALWAGEPPMEAAAFLAFHGGPPSGVEALTPFRNVVAGGRLAAREGLRSTLLLLLGFDWAIFAPVHLAACVAGPRRGVVGLPALSGVGGLVDVLSIRGLCLCGREKGVVDRAADAEEVGGEGVLPSGQEVRVDGAEYFHCWGVGLELPTMGESPPLYPWGRVLGQLFGKALRLEREESALSGPGRRQLRPA